MKKISRILCLLLVISMFSLVLIACGDDEPSGTATSGNTSGNGGNSNNSGNGDNNAAGNNSGNTDTENEGFRLEKQNFGGTTIKFLTDQATDYISWEVAPQELAEGDRVNNAFYNRKAIIEQEYGLILEQEYAENQSAIVTTARDYITSGLDEYQVYVAGLLYLAMLTGDELLLDLSSIDSNDYLDFTKPYWDQSIMRDLTVLDSVYFATGDALVTDDDATWAVFFNKDIANDYRVAENHGVSSLYDFVNEGKWTIDLMYELAQEVTSDNGDAGMAWGADTPDTWGLLSQCYDSYAFTVGCGETLMQNDGTEITITAGRQSCVGAFDKVFTMLTDRNHVAIAEKIGPSGTCYTELIDMFAAGKGLFMPNRIATVSNPVLRNADIHYGLLPMPKVNEQQEEYTTTVTVYWCSAFAIPITNVEKLDATCYALEAMAYYGMKDVTPEYYDHTLKDKRFEDPESLEMLDLIFRNRTYDMSAVFNFSNSLTFFTGILLNGLNGQSNSHIATLESVEDSWQLAIDDYIAQIKDARG